MRLKKDFSAIIVGETGYILMPLAWMLSRIWGKKLFFDAFFSCYEAYVLDRKRVRPGTIEAKKLFFLDKFGCALADIVILDTYSHIDYFKEQFGLKNRIFKRVLVGADDAVFSVKTRARGNGRFIVLFWGTFIPLHGVEYILKAADILKSDGTIIFKLIGRGQTYPMAIKTALDLNLKNIEFSDFKSEDVLAEEIATADVCLGVFGDTGKPMHVIPHKVFQSSAMKKPSITGDSPAVKEVFRDNVDIVLAGMADPAVIADKIMMLKNDSGLRHLIAENAYKNFTDNFTPKIVTKPLVGLL
ncbi:MAG: glycosyltransferase [Elusimicrobiota bacterium]